MNQTPTARFINRRVFIYAPAYTPIMLFGNGKIPDNRKTTTHIPLGKKRTLLDGRKTLIEQREAL